ncbi:8-oxo-dGTP pyrophosphatase MutT (NUDIX family) [Nocardia kruczakiae]|uniref:8-oxo-dGTP pyrophosphatase MutT (NUDIX family) n=1 Tax=Nocardia kruczakiae TaxID=261477 RepID=A0ABU1X7G2_9NOCA|nr:CoA pyrophosphatase [Nocardia kruczakiae]MDR7166486.1 8-oxo-dGTP pyrophosphatase MutT (NUDIX family) [Nocardia kruczakiae]
MSVQDFRELAAGRLREFEFRTVADVPGMRRASVVLCVLEHDGQPCVVVIKRAYRGRNAGQWALPGGRVDGDETAVAAGLRELHEEIGLVAPPTSVLGRLDDFPAASGFAITPIVVALDDPGALYPNDDEVHAVHFVRLDRLAADDVPHWVDRPDGSRLLQLRIGDSMTIHAPTGGILLQFRDVVLLGRDTRVADLLQPDWTHK